ncbi:MAG: protein of unknown function DUF1003, partial [uncultured Microvirga sp.]
DGEAGRRAGRISGRLRQPDLPSPVRQRDEFGPRAQYRGSQDPPFARGDGGFGPGKGRGPDHPVHREHAVRLPASCRLRVLDPCQSRPRARRQQVGRVVRGPRHDRFGRGDLPHPLRPDQPEPHVRRRRQARRSRP